MSDKGYQVVCSLIELTETAIIDGYLAEEQGDPLPQVQWCLIAKVLGVRISPPATW